MRSKVGISMVNVEREARSKWELGNRERESEGKPARAGEEGGWGWCKT